MKRISILFLLGLTSFLLIGCNNKEESLEDGIQNKQDEVKSLISEKGIFEYVQEGIEFEQFDSIKDEDETIFMYNILLPVNSSYLELNSSEQYSLLRDLTQEIFELQGGSYGESTPKGMAINGAKIKYQSLVLNFDDNKKNNYKISLNNEEVITFMSDNDGEISNVIFATISDEEYVILNSGMILREGEYVRQGQWVFTKSDTNLIPNQTNEPNREIIMDNQTKEFLEWQVKSGEWNKEGK
ncbi:hypothetical protein MKX53_18770 [Psychrobacillus sp. FSL K6-4615]|uniref:hypothetical protein n=1 Tax=Psychrobacillus sp. FSL K6-4615 TaxID=2921551 RepID=UPI0030F61057